MDRLQFEKLIEIIFSSLILFIGDYISLILNIFGIQRKVFWKSKPIEKPCYNEDILPFGFVCVCIFTFIIYIYRDKHILHIIKLKSYCNWKWGLVTHCSKANKRARLVERKVCSIFECWQLRRRVNSWTKADSSSLWTIHGQELL